MKFSVILSNVGNCSDRYMAEGYSPKFSLEQLFDRLVAIDGVSGVELVGTWHVTDENMETLSRRTQEAGLSVVAIIPDHFGTPIWGRGAFTSPDPVVREAAYKEMLKMADAARILKCPTISIWNGQDGYDYPLQADYVAAHQWLAEGIKASALAMPDLKVALEYKPKEPRNHCFIPNVWSAVTMSQESGLANVGVTIDVGHSFEAYENASEAVAIAQSRGKLFHMHINDNYRLWDDDMICGSVHTVEFIELFYWLKRLGYEGHVSVDQYPYREDSKKAAEQSIRWMQAFDRASDRIDMEKMKEILLRQDAVASTEYIRELIFG